MVERRSIDLNSDVGEGFGAWPGGPDAALMPLLTSVNVACGFHAGDPSIMRRTCALAVEHGCVIGAQVSYPDIVGFGRRFIDMHPDDLADAVVYQLGALEAFARTAGSAVRYVKPHGALYNAIVTNQAQAAAVARAAHQVDSSLAVMGLPGSAIQRACRTLGLRFVTEGFADRGYTSEGTLVSRSEPGALITDLARWLQQWPGRRPQLELRIAERSLAAMPAPEEVLPRLVELGARIVIDEFGRHFSSLTRLVSLPIAALQIDRQFVLGSAHDPAALRLCRGAIAIARELDIPCYASGVDSQEDRDRLQALGISEGIGDCFGDCNPAAPY